MRKMKDNTNSIQVIERLARLLDVIGAHKDSASLKTLSAETGLHPSTAFRILASLAEQGLGLAYSLEPMVLGPLREGRLQRVLERYAPTVPGFFLYFPSVARRSPPLRLFAETARELAVRALP